MDVVIAAVLGVLIGSVCNRLIVREPGYVVTDPRDLPDDADDALLDELEELGVLPDVPVLALLRPRRWHRWWFPVVEVVCAASLAVAADRFESIAVTVAVGFLFVALLTMGTIDFRVYRIPDRVNFPSLAVGAVLVVVASLVEDAPRAVVGAAAGAVLYAGLLFGAHLAYPRGMGWGDVKLAWLMGLYLGWFGGAVSGGVGDQLLGALQFVLYGAAAGSLLGVVIGVPYAVAKRSATAAFPYGPALAIGCALVIVYGHDLSGRT